MKRNFCRSNLVQSTAKYTDNDLGGIGLLVQRSWDSHKLGSPRASCPESGLYDIQINATGVGCLRGHHRSVAPAIPCVQSVDCVSARARCYIPLNPSPFADTVPVGSLPWQCILESIALGSASNFGSRWGLGSGGWGVVGAPVVWTVWRSNLGFEKSLCWLDARALRICSRPK